MTVTLMNNCFVADGESCTVTAFLFKNIRHLSLTVCKTMCNVKLNNDDNIYQITCDEQTFTQIVVALDSYLSTH